ncbi:MAG: outer membrane beta-barrel protein [Planctomycetes bacterium]|nr:outer membrane beta-barrel protein [Planctomycetota bacterium]
MTVDRVCKTLAMSAAVAVVFAASWVKAENTSAEDTKEILARMRAMEEKMASQDKEIGALKGKLKQAEAYNAAKPDIHMQVDKALDQKTPPAWAYVHDTGLINRPIKFGGMLDVQYQYSFNQPHTQNTTNAGASPDFRVFGGGNFNSFQVSQVDLYLDATAQEKGQAGFRVDWNLGRDPASAGYTLTTLNGGGTTNTGLQQAYIDYLADIGNGIRFKLGKLVTCYGFEVIEGADNWNVSRSFNFERAIPFTHTGLDVEYSFNDKFSMMFMVVNDLFQGDPGLDANFNKDVMIQTKWTPVKWFTWIVNAGAGQDDNRSPTVERGPKRYQDNWLYLINTNMTFTPWEKWSFGLDATLGDRIDGESRFNRGHFNRTGEITYDDGQFYGVAGYLKYQFLKNWYFAARYEMFWDLDGATGGPTGDPLGTPAVGLAPAVPGTDLTNPGIKLTSATGTIDWALSDPLHVRFEYRHDENFKTGGHVTPGYRTSNGQNAAGATPYRNTNDTLTMSWVLKF